MLFFSGEDLHGCCCDAGKDEDGIVVIECPVDGVGVFGKARAVREAIVSNRPLGDGRRA